MELAEILDLLDEATAPVTTDLILERQMGINSITLASWRAGVPVAVPPPPVVRIVATLVEQSYSTVLTSFLQATGHLGTAQYSVAPSPQERARLIEDEWGARFRLQRQRVEDVIASDDPYSFAANRMGALSGRVDAIDSHGVGLHVGWQIIDPSTHGSFGSHSDPRLVIFMTKPFDRAAAKYQPRWWPVSDGELEDWVYVAFGAGWFDFGYRVVNAAGLVRSRPSWFCVFVGRDAQPFLAPDDFQWHVAGSGGPATRHKLRPRKRNGWLEDHLTKIGDVTSYPDLE